MDKNFRLGSDYTQEATSFQLWAVNASKVNLWLSPDNSQVWIPDVKDISVEILLQHNWRCIRLKPSGKGIWDFLSVFFRKFLGLKASRKGYWGKKVDRVALGTLYLYELTINDAPFIIPDPCSYHQPAGVHGASQVISLDFPWEDQAWKGVEWKDLAIYQAHTQLVSPDETLEGLTALIPHLKSLSVSLYLLPIMEYAGERDLGYNGTYFFAIHHLLGGLIGAQRLINALHLNGIPVILDMHIHNHFGSEGAYAYVCGGHFTEKYQTPWGAAKNYDDGESAQEARHHILEVIRFYFEVLHADGLRMDACHAVYDSSDPHIFKEMQQLVNELSEKLGKPLFLLAEYNDDKPTFIQSVDAGGYGWEGQLHEGLHHAFVNYYNPNLSGYFVDYRNKEKNLPLNTVAEILRKGYGKSSS